MNGWDDELETLVEMLEDDESDDSDEATRRQRFRGRPRTATGRGMYTPRPQGNYVTQTQLQTALAKVGEQLRTNSNAIAAVTTRVNTVAAGQTKQIAALRSELNNTRQMSILPLLLSRPPAIESLAIKSATDAAGTTIPPGSNITNTAGTELQVDAKYKSDSNNMLPLV